MLDLDAYSDNHIVSVPDLQYQNMWVLNFMDIADPNKDFPNKDFLIQSSNIPLFSLSLEKTNFDLVVPESKENYGTFNITFYETSGFEGFNYCHDWITSVYDFDNRLFKKDFNTKKKNATIRFIKILPTSQGILGFNLLSNNKIIQTAQFNLFGLMIKGISDVDLGEDGEPLTFSVDMEIQNVQYIKGNAQII